MKITADTNLLVRAAVLDHPAESALAVATLQSAERIAVASPTLCEFVWVLSRGYRRSPDEIALAVRRLIGAATVLVDVPAVLAGLDSLEAGGDFADGVIAFEGRRLGGDIFVTYDRKAAKILKAKGVAALLLKA